MGLCCVLLPPPPVWNLAVCYFRKSYCSHLNTLCSFIATALQEVLAQTQEKTALSLSEVQWHGRTIPIKNERVRLSLVKLHQMFSDLRREEGPEKMNVYDNLLMECQDAMQLVRDELHQDLVSSSASLMYRKSVIDEVHKCYCIVIVDLLPTGLL